MFDFLDEYGLGLVLVFVLLAFLVFFILVSFFEGTAHCWHFFEDGDYCSDCGVALKAHCSVCGGSVDNKPFCPSCGAALN